MPRDAVAGHYLGLRQMVVAGLHGTFEHTQRLPEYLEFAGFLPFRHLHQIRRNHPARKDEGALVDYDPLNDLTLGELHGLSKHGGEGYVILFVLLTTDELDFGLESHGGAD